MQHAGVKRKRPADDDADETAAFETAPRAVRPEWKEQGGAGRLPLKLAGGRVAAPAPRPTSHARPTNTSSHGGIVLQEADEDAAGVGVGGAGSMSFIKMHKRARREAAEEETRRARKKELAAAEAAADASSDGEGSDSDEDKGDSDGGAAKPAHSGRSRAPRDDSDDDDEEEHEGEDSEDDEARAETDVAAIMASSDGIRSMAALRALPKARVLERREGLKLRIAELAERIITSPETSIYTPPGKEGKGVPSGGNGGKGDKKVAKRSERYHNCLAELHVLCGDGDPVIRRLALLSTLAVFKDIAPGYRIRLPSKAERTVKVKKEVLKMRMYEAALLGGYQRFLQVLEKTAVRGEAAAKDVAAGKDPAEPMVAAGSAEGGGVGFSSDSYGAGDEAEGGGGKRSGMGKREYSVAKMEAKRAKKAAAAAAEEYDADRETLHALGVTAVQAMGQLLTALFHFNFRSNLVAFLVPRMSSRDEDVRSAACAAVGEALAGDKSCETAVEVGRALSAQVKAAAYRPGGFASLHPDCVSVLLRLQLSHLEREDRESALKASQAAKRKKANAPPDEVLEGLKMADAEALDEKKRNGKAALREMVTVYFRVLRSPAAANLLPPVLQGLSKFGHLIDVSVVTDLLFSLRALLKEAAGDIGGDGGDGGGEDGDDEAAAAAPVRKNRLALECVLNCVYTGLRIMHGPGEMLNADETEFVSALYGALLRLTHPGQHVHAPLAAHATHLLFCGFRREYTDVRVAAFIKRLFYVALHLVSPAAAMSLVSVGRALLARYPKAAVILGPASDRVRIGVAGDIGGREQLSGLINEAAGAVYDPEAAKATSSTLWEAAALMGHYHPPLRASAAAATRGTPVPPSEAFDVVYATYDESSGAFNPPPPQPREHPLAAKWREAATAGKGGAPAVAAETQTAPVPSNAMRGLFMSRERAGAPLPAWFTTAVGEAGDAGDASTPIADADVAAALEAHYGAALRRRVEVADQLLHALPSWHASFRD